MNMIPGRFDRNRGEPIPDQHVWSEHLGRCLISSLPDADLTRQWGELSSGSLEQLRQELLDWAGDDEEVRRWVVRAWREAHPDVVEAADQAVLEGLTEDAIRSLEAFAPEDALLALLTDEFDDGRGLARAFLSRLEDDSQRRALQIVLKGLAGEKREASPRRVRVVILGGHPRDESKLGQRLFQDGPFEVRWESFEKKPSSRLIKKAVAPCGRGNHHYGDGQPHADAICQGLRPALRAPLPVHRKGDRQPVEDRPVRNVPGAGGRLDVRSESFVVAVQMKTPAGQSRRASQLSKRIQTSDPADQRPSACWVWVESLRKYS